VFFLFYVPARGGGGGGGAVKRLDREFYHSAFYRVEVTNHWNYIYSLY